MKMTECQALRERIFSGRLPNGLSLHILPKPGFRQKAGLVAVDFGAIDNHLQIPGTQKSRDLPAGLAHFLEHRLFEKNDGDIAERFSALGAEVDADTSCTSTSFSFSCTDHFCENLDLLLELAFRLDLTEEGVDREREIIAHEIGLYADNLESIAYYNALDAIYPGQLLGMDIAGSVSSIQGIDRDLLQVCHERFYQPGNARLLVCGDVAAEEVWELVEGWWKGHCAVIDSGLKRPDRHSLTDLELASRQTTLAIAHPYLLLAFKDRHQGLVGEPLLRRELALELILDLLFGPGSRFVSQWYAEGLIDTADFGFELQVETAFSHCLIGGETPCPPRLEAAIAEELERAGRQGLEAAAFERVRRKAYGALLRGFDQIEDCVALMERAVSCGAGPFDYLEAYKRLRIADLEDCLETCLTPEYFGRSQVDPLPKDSMAGYAAAPITAVTKGLQLQVDPVTWL